MRVVDIFCDECGCNENELLRRLAPHWKIENKIKSQNK
jgi:hypothetical protein